LNQLYFLVDYLALDYIIILIGGEKTPVFRGFLLRIKVYILEGRRDEKQCLLDEMAKKNRLCAIK
jgi:hypothetical protein